MPSKKTRKIAVHGSFIADVAEKIEEHGLTVVIVGPSPRWEEAIEVEFQYEPSERRAVHEVEDLLDDLWTGNGYPADWAEPEGEEFEEEEEEEDD